MKSPSTKPKDDCSASLHPREFLGARYLRNSFSKNSTSNEHQSKPAHRVWFVPPVPVITLAIFLSRAVRCNESSSPTSMMTPIRPDDVKKSCLGESLMPPDISAAASEPAQEGQIKK
jgi:hypothetical protein